MKTSNTLSLGFSPCPNDTFIFDALVHHRFPQNTNWNYSMHDVETLNRNAKEALFDVSKLSFPAFAFSSSNYQILSSGSALGKNCGPLLISKKPLTMADLANCKIAIPGKYTTANLLLSIFAPHCENKTEMVFSSIESAVLSGDFDAGLIIHENRFTYAQRGLLKVADMGELWEMETGLPIPLGCIAVRRNLCDDLKREIQVSIKKSVEFAYANPNVVQPFVSENAQEMSAEVQQQHISLYVNEFSIDLGNTGMNAVRYLLEKGFQSGLLPPIQEPVFLANN